MTGNLKLIVEIFYISRQCCGSGMLIPDPGPTQSILTQKNYFLSSRKMIRVVHPGSRGKKDTGSRIRIRNTVSWRRKRKHPSSLEH
jgi:hypothetical protein